MKNVLIWLGKLKYNKNDWRSYPILIRWHESGRMLKEMKIIGEKVDYLLSQGANSKVNEWFSGDMALTQITAERYLLDKLRRVNRNLEEKFTGGGVDAYLVHSGSKIGIEVTTMNQSIAEWILQERLLIYLNLHGYTRKDTICQVPLSLDIFSRTM